MKIISKSINWKTKTLVVRLALEIDTDDCWNLFNLMNKGDLIKGTAYRKIQKES